MPVPVSAPRGNPDVYLSEHDLLRTMLRSFLVAKVESGGGAGEGDHVACAAGAALESLLAAHPVDRQGRCTSCRAPGWLRRRHWECMVFAKAHCWLRQPTHFMQTQLADELGIALPTPPTAANPATDPLQTPAAAPSPTADPTTEAGQPRRATGGRPWPS